MAHTTYLSIDDILSHEHFRLGLMPSINCRRAMVQHIKDVNLDEISKEPVARIIRLSKLAKNFLLIDETFRGQLEKLYQYHVRGLAEIDKLIDTKGQIRNTNYFGGISSHKDIIILTSMFLSNTGNIAKIIFERTGNWSFGEAFFDYYNLSAELSKEVHPAHALHSYNKAATACKQLAESAKNTSKKLDWLENGFLYFELIFDLIKKNNLPFDKMAYMNRGIFARDYFILINSINPNKDNFWFAEQAYNNFILSAKYFSETPRPSRENQAFYDYYNAGIAAQHIYLHGKALSWKKKSKECFKHVVEFSVSHPDKEMQKRIDESYRRLERLDNP